MNGSEAYSPIYQNELYKELLSKNRSKLFYELLGGDINKIDNYNTFYFSFQNKPNELSVTDILWKELNEGKRLGKNYSHIIFTVEYIDFNNKLEKKIQDIFQDIISDNDFKVRESSTYKNLALFQQSCGEVLSKMAEVYMAPGIVCENLIERIGFSSDSCGSF